MGPVILDITNAGSLYEAWSATTLVEIEDFNCKEVAQSFFQDIVPNGDPQMKTKCVKETWIKELPKVLLFTINRVNYDFKLKKLVKNSKRFDFEKVLYADKFLLSKRSKEGENNEQVQQLRDKQKAIRESLKQYKEYYKGMGLIEIMEVTKGFIESQGEDYVDIDKNGNSVRKGAEQKAPSQLGKIGKKEQDIKNAIGVIAQY